MTPTYLFVFTNIKGISRSDFELKHFDITTTETTVFINGVLEFGISKAFLSVLNQNPAVSLVVLDSVGGIISEAESIAEIIEGKKLSTVIVGECLSACTRVFAAGTNRIMLTKSNIGFHSPSYLFSNSLIDELEIEQLYEFLTNKGFPSELVDDIRHTPAEEMWYIPTIPLLKSGFITSFATNLSEAEAALGGGNIVQQESEYEEAITHHNGLISVNLGAEEILFPVPQGLIAFQSGEYNFDVFDSITTPGNKLLLVLARESDFLNPEFETEGFKLYARIEYMEFGKTVDRSFFEQLKEFMVSNYTGLTSESEDGVQTALDKGSQRLSQTTGTDVRVQSVALKPMRIIENSSNYLMLGITIEGQLQKDGTTQTIEQNGIQVMSFMKDRIILINWYANRQPETLSAEMLSYAKYFTEKAIELNDSSNP